MSKSVYRWLVIVSFVLPILCMIGEATIFAHLIPPEIKAAMDRHIEQETASNLWEALAFVLGAVALALALPIQIYGFLRFKAWAPKFAIWLTAVSYVTMPFLGVAVYSGILSTAMSLGAMLWGIVVVLPYVSPEVRNHFWPRHPDSVDENRATYGLGNG